MNVQDLPATAARLRHVAGRLRFSEEAYTRARAVAGLELDASEWRSLIDRFLLAFGVALVVAGVAAFFAYNWGGLHKFGKFGLIQAAVVACAALSVRRGLDSAYGRVALLSAGFLVGVSLAVYGQVYQTGADHYGLFVAWAALILPLALVGRQGGLWMLMIVLLNLSTIFYWTQVLHPQSLGLDLFGPLVALTGTFTDARLADLVFTLNVAALVSWEALSGRGVVWLQGRTLPRILSLLALTPVLVASFFLIVGATFGDHAGWAGFALILFLGFAGVSFVYYRLRVHDLFILTACALGGITLLTAFVAQVENEPLLLAALVVGLTAAASAWLRRVARQWEEAT